MFLKKKKIRVLSDWDYPKADIPELVNLMKDEDYKEKVSLKK